MNDTVLPIFAPACIWCQASWSDKNVRLFDVDGADQCEDGRMFPETGSVSIVCHSCNREQFRKLGIESDDTDNWAPLPSAPAPSIASQGKDRNGGEG